MYGYKCPACTHGIIVKQNFTDYKTKIGSEETVIPNAEVGVCDKCGEHHVHAQVLSKWISDFDKEEGNWSITKVLVGSGLGMLMLYLVWIWITGNKFGSF